MRYIETSMQFWKQRTQAQVESPEAAPEAVKAFVRERFGDRAVSYDPSDAEANKLATSAGSGAKR